MNSQSDGTSSHGDTMDRMYKLQRHFYDLTRRHYLLGRDKMLDGLNAKPGQNILEIGCGTGRNLVGAARRYSNCNLYGVDISNEMLKTTAKALRRAGVQSRVTITQGDATDFNSVAVLKKKTFERVYFSYTLSMVPQWEAALRHATTFLADGGELHIVDFGQCEKWPLLPKTLLFKWLKLFHVFPRSDLPLVLNRLAEENHCTLVTKKDFGGYAWRFILH